MRKNYNKNLLLGSHLISDGSCCTHMWFRGWRPSGRITADNIKEFGMLRLMDAPKMKGLLNSVSMPNWINCIDQALLENRE